MCIRADYPVTPPIFAISVKECDDDFTQAIQIKVNYRMNFFLAWKFLSKCKASANLYLIVKVS